MKPCTTGKGRKGGVVLAIFAMSLFVAHGSDGQGFQAINEAVDQELTGESLSAQASTDIGTDNTTPPAPTLSDYSTYTSLLSSKSTATSTDSLTQSASPSLLLPPEDPTPNIVLNPDRVLWQPTDTTEPALILPLNQRLSLLGSTSGGGVTAADNVESYHGLKEFPGLDAIPDHELSLGLALPLSPNTYIGAAYRFIGAEAQWNTDHYRDRIASPAPLLVDDNENHSLVLFLRFKF